MSYFKKIPHAKLQTFAVDVTLVSLQIRTGYLFDAFSLARLHWSKTPSYILADTIRVLRKKSKAFHDVVVLHDIVHDQLFFVNVPLLLRRCHEEFCLDIQAGSKADDASRPYTTFVLLDDHPRLLHDIPAGVLHLLQTLCPLLEANTTSAYPQELLTIPSSHDTSTSDIIPFAAVILEYPIAYVPVSPDQSAFLPWEVLDAYECILMIEEGKTKTRCTICKFSCPKSLSHYGGLGIDQLQEMLGKLFTTRVKCTDVEGHVEVRHHQETHERVAL